MASVASVASLLGLGSGGVEASGLWAAVQSAAATGRSVVPVLVTSPALAVPVWTVGLFAGAAAVTVAVRRSLQLPSRGTCDSPTTTGGRYVVAAHRYGKVLFWQLDAEEDAREVFDALRVRCVLVDLGEKTTPELAMERQWVEMCLANPTLPWVDEHIRRDLSDAFRREHDRVLPNDPTGFHGEEAGVYLVAAHDYGDVHVWQHRSVEEARKTFEGLRLRRLLLQLHSGADTSVVGRKWTEVDRDGANESVDDEIRDAVVRCVEHARSVEPTAPGDERV